MFQMDPHVARSSLHGGIKDGCIRHAWPPSCDCCWPNWGCAAAFGELKSIGYYYMHVFIL